MELKIKRAWLEEKQMEMYIQTRREEREFQLQMINMLTRNTHVMSSPSYSMHSHYGYGGYDPDATQDSL